MILQSKMERKYTIVSKIWKKIESDISPSHMWFSFDFFSNVTFSDMHCSWKIIIIINYVKGRNNYHGYIIKKEHTNKIKI